MGEIELDNPFLQEINESLPVSRRIRAGIDTGILTAGMISRELGGHPMSIGSAGHAAGLGKMMAPETLIDRMAIVLIHNPLTILSIWEL